MLLARRCIHKPDEGFDHRLYRRRSINVDRQHYRCDFTPSQVGRGKTAASRRPVRLLPEQWGTYFEPFIGGGALLVELANRGRLGRAVIGDLNPELMNLYRVVKRDPGALTRALSDGKYRNDPESFGILRKEFNGLIGTGKAAGQPGCSPGVPEQAQLQRSLAGEPERTIQCPVRQACPAQPPFFPGSPGIQPDVYRELC